MRRFGQLPKMACITRFELCASRHCDTVRNGLNADMELRRNEKKGIKGRIGRRGLNRERKMNGKGTRNEWRKSIGRETLKEHKLHELIRTRE